MEGQLERIEIERAAEKAETQRLRRGIERRLEYWRSEEGQTLITGMVREGMRAADIAKRIGITPSRFSQWMAKYEEIDKAVREGSELNDYRVENALLKSALGYKAKNVTITSTYRYGKLVETTRTEEEVDVAPNINAQKTWLFNRRPSQWVPESKIAGVDDDDDGTIQVEVINMATVDQDEEEDLEKQALGNAVKELASGTDKDVDDAVVDLDYWPDDWEDEEESWDE